MSAGRNYGRGGRRPHNRPKAGNGKRKPNQTPKRASNFGPKNGSAGNRKGSQHGNRSNGGRNRSQSSNRSTGRRRGSPNRGRSNPNRRGGGNRINVLVEGGVPVAGMTSVFGDGMRIDTSTVSQTAEARARAVLDSKDSRIWLEQHPLATRLARKLRGR